MNNKDNKEPVPEKKYVAFHKERQQPVDCFSRHEIGKKLKSLQESFDSKLEELKDEIEDFHREELAKVKAQFDKILKKISQKFQEYYTQEKIDQIFNVSKSSYNNLERTFELLEKQHVKLEELVLEYMEVTDIGKNVGGHFILNEKKRFWKK